MLRAGLRSYDLPPKSAARIFSLFCSVQIQNSYHRAQFYLYFLIQKRRSIHRAGICLRWQVRANSSNSCNLLAQHKNSHFNLLCHEILKHTVVRGVSVGRGCSNTYYRSLATWKKKKVKRQTCSHTDRICRTDKKAFSCHSFQKRDEKQRRDEYRKLPICGYWVM